MSEKMVAEETGGRNDETRFVN